MKVFVLILLLFAIGPSLCEILTSVSPKKAIIYSDKEYESHTVFINSGNNERLKHIITQECEIHGFLKTAMTLTRMKRFLEIIEQGLSAYAEIQEEMRIANIEGKVEQTAKKVYEIAEKGRVMEQKVNNLKDITSRLQIEMEADDVIRSAINMLFNNHKLSPLLLDINSLVERFVSHDLGNIRLIDLIQAKVTNCNKVVGDDRVFVAISVRIPNKIEVEEFTESIDTGFVHEEHYYFFDLPRAVYSKNGTQFMIPLDKCIEKDNYLCPFRVIEQTACFYGNTSECSLIAVPLENNKCGITSIRREPAFGAIVVANTKEMFEVGGGSSRTMEVEPNSVLKVNVRHGKVIEVCDQTITSMRHDLDETKIDVIPSALKEAWPAQENDVLEKMAQSRFGKDFGKDGQLPIKSSFSMELIVGISVLIGIIVLLLGLFCYCCRHHYKRVETE